MSMDPHREYCRRQHRLLAHHLSIEAWCAGDDCILLERNHLEEFLKLERFKTTRVQWLLEDIKPWFKHTEPVYSGPEGELSSLEALYLSRVPIARKFLVRPDPINADELVAWLRNNGLRVNLLHSVSAVIPPSEEQIVTRLALLASGLAEP
ncbi:hypothetical protein ACN28E_30360 [Archangium lansingense]|uniref:hypothetical protein n=1 Tax=Archangium lansingense TaxID=2995310 RepID=UPI003B78A144